MRRVYSTAANRYSNRLKEEFGGLDKGRAPKQQSIWFVGANSSNRNQGQAQCPNPRGRAQERAPSDARARRLGTTVHISEEASAVRAVPERGRSRGLQRCGSKRYSDVDHHVGIVYRWLWHWYHRHTLVALDNWQDIAVEQWTTLNLENPLITILTM